MRSKLFCQRAGALEVLTRLGLSPWQQSNMAQLSTTALAWKPAQAKTNDAPAKGFNEVPGPQSIPFLGNFLNVKNPETGMDPKHILKTMSKMYEDHGDIVRVEVPFRPPFVFLYNPDHCEQVYRATGSQPIRPGFVPFGYAQRILRKDLEENKRGLLFTNKQDWRDFRSKVQKPMLRPRSTTGYVKHLEEIANQFIDDRLRPSRNENLEVPDYFLEDLYKWALESVAMLALNTRLGCLETQNAQGSDQVKMINAVSDIFELTMILENGLQLWRFLPFQTRTMKRYVETVRTFYMLARLHIENSLEVLKNNPTEGEEKTLLELFLAHGCDTETAVSMALDMLFAGIDTSSHSTAFCLFYLAKYPEVQEKLAAEIKEKAGENLTKETIDSLSYLKAVFKETMRLASPAQANARVIEDDIEVGGYVLPKGTHAVMCHMTMSTSPKLISDPEVFRPERWIKSSKEYENIHPFITLPFGHGARMCVGRRFAELEVYILLTKLIQNFRVEWHHPDLGIITQLITKPDSPLRFRFIDRK